MAVDFYIEKQLRLSINETVFVRLDAAQDELRRRTGRAVDAYATTVLSPEHAALWRDSLQQLSAILEQDHAAREACESIVALLGVAVRDRLSLIIEGE